jgi:hypothetical protein
MENFEIKSEEILAKMTGEELAGYYNELNAQKSSDLEKLVEAKASKEEISELKAELKAVRDTQFKSLEARLKNAELMVKKLNDQEKSDASEILNSVEKGLSAHKDALQALKGDRSASLNFKVAGTMLISTNISGGNVPVEQRIAGVNNIASRRIRLLDVVTRGTAESNVISWVYQANKDGAAGGTAEGALKNQIDFDLVVASESVKKRTAFIKVSEEMVGDISFMTAEINNELMRELLKDVENQVYQGDGTGTNLNGIKTVATAFAAGSFAGTVDNANEADVLTVAMNQIQVAEHDNANYAFVHPNTITTLKLIKTSTTDRRYIDRLAMVAGQLSLDGVTLVPTTLVTDGEYLIGNFDLSTVYDRGDISIEVGRDSDDFTKNLVTVLAEWRGLCIVKNNDRTAFIEGVFATDKTALNV